MRPLKLTMEAFGPFTEKTEIDFTDFQMSELVLVTGSTGSGKTTIFDALIYALYGQTSGQGRSQDTIKSQFATDMDLCQVELTFEIYQENYHIRRIPPQRGPNKAGTGSKEYKSEVILTTPKASIEKVTPVREAIEELLGMDVNQFRQIVMLPQGEFKKLLEASSEDKQDIFQHIFQTEYLNDFAKIIKDKRKDLEKEYSKTATQIETILNQIESEDTELKEAILINNLDEVIRLLKLSQIKLEKTIAEEKNEEQLLLKKQENLSQYLRLLDSLTTLEDILERLKQKKPQIEADRLALNRHQQLQGLLRADAQLKVTQKRLVNYQKQVDDLEEQITLLKDDITKVKLILKEQTPAYQKLTKNHERLFSYQKEEESWEKINDLDLTLKKKLASLTALIDQLNYQEREEKLLSAQVKELLDQEIKLNDNKVDLNQIYDTLSKEKDSLQELNFKQSKLEEIEKVNRDLEETQQKLILVDQTLQDKQSHFKQLEVSYQVDLASQLRGQLEPNQPCLVCGSPDHPWVGQVTNITSQQVSEVDLREAKEAYDNVWAEHLRVSSQLKDRTTNLNNLLIAQKLELEEIPKAQEELTTSQDENLKNQEELQKEINKQNKLDNQLNLLRLERESLTEKHQSLSQNLIQSQQKKAVQEREIKSIEDQKVDLIKSLSFKEESELKEKISQLRQDISQVEADYNQAKDKLNDLSEQKSALSSRLESLKESTEDQKNEVEAAQDNYNQELQENNFDKDWRLYILDKEKLERFQVQVQDFDLKVTENKGRLKQVKVDLDNNPFRNLEDNPNNFLEEIRINLEVKDKNLQNFYSQFDQIKQQAHRLEDFQNNHQELASIYADLKEIDDLASGSKETLNISFERYVLGLYFDRVLEAANLRLQKMTAGRYYLIREKGKIKGSANNGLEINVFDDYSGGLRSVKTLSGGESFKASLSLALGLSDIIQESAGGIHIDTLFIDEGFGSLDAGSLDQAIQVLMDLNDQTNRFIGIISHVSELKERLPDQIQVIAGQNGSKIKTQVNSYY